MDSHHIPSTYLQSIAMDKEIKTQVYQMSLWHKKFAEMLHIVVIVKTNLQTNKTAQVVLFRSALTLRYDLLIDDFATIHLFSAKW